MLFFLALFAVAVAVGYIVWLCDLDHKLPLSMGKPSPADRISLQETRWIMRLGTKSLTKDMELGGLSYKDILLYRVIIFALFSFIPPALLFLIGMPILVIVAPVAVGIGGAVFVPPYLVRSRANTLRFELWQAFPQFLSTVSMAMSSLNLASAVTFAANASEHRTFQFFRQLIPPPNSDKQFGQRLYEFGEKYNVPELSNRGLILRTAEEVGSGDIRENIKKQAADSRISLFTQIEEDQSTKAGSGSVSSIGIVLGLMLFIIYPVFTSLTGGLDFETIISDTEEQSETSEQ